MCNNSNKQLKTTIDDNANLLAKMENLTAQLQTSLMADFQTVMGVPLPDVARATVRQVTYDMVYSTDPIADQYISAAKTLLDSSFQGDQADIANKALDVVQVLIDNIVGSSSIQTGGNGESIQITPNNGKGKYLSAAFTQIQECSAQDWSTQTNFYVAYYVFVVWQPTADNLEAYSRATKRYSSTVR